MARITVTPQTVRLNPSDTAPLTAVALDAAGGTVANAPLVWTSSNSALATVSTLGVVTAVSIGGPVAITATSNGVSAFATVTVIARPAVRVDVTASSSRLTAIGSTVQLQATVRDRSGTVVNGSVVTWGVRDTMVARISATGALTAVSNGSTTVIATVEGIEGELPIQVEQQTARLAGVPATLDYTALMDSSSIRVTTLDANGFSVPGVTVVFGSSDDRIATVSNSGVVRAISPGSANITARVGSITAAAAVQVSQTPAAMRPTGASNRNVTISETTVLQADVIDRNGFRLPSATIVWTSSNPAILSVESASSVRALRAGSARMTASTPGATVTALVDFSVSNTKVETIPSALSVPAAGAQWEIPVVIIRYIPTLDGRRVDSTETVIRGSPEEIRARTDVLNERIKYMLEEGSKFRGYLNPSAVPSIGYRVVHIVTVYAPFTKGRQVPWNAGHYFPDYQKILDLVDARTWVEQKGVKEFWIWGYQSDNFEQPESNMSSPFTGDISNSSRFNDDLPIFGKSYTVYGYNYARSQAEAVHNHGHQLEALLGYINSDLFWREFVGKDAAGNFIMGRAGWTHMPPNTLVEYDYLNDRPQPSDIADWKPGGGRTAPVSLSTWANQSYRWPSALAPGEGTIAQKAESQWYMYWMQNMPGLNNTIPASSGQMTNWWQFTGDWDSAIQRNAKLATVPTGLAIEIQNDFRGGILLNPGGEITPGQSIILYSSVPLLVSVWDCGHPGTTTCIMDPYTLTPGKKYRVIEHPNGPVNNLTIVERP